MPIDWNERAKFMLDWMDPRLREAVEAEAASRQVTELRAAVEALQSAITTGRKAMKEREADLTWCNKPDRCHDKAEGVTLAVDDFDEAIINALGEPARALLSAGDKAEAPRTLVCERNESAASAHGHTADCYR